jgi:DNA-binding transcriptional MerR regulator
MNQLLPSAPPAPSGQRLFTVQEAASLTGLSEHNLRYYERVGLLRHVERLPESGHRRYTNDDLDWIYFLACLRETRMPIDQMRRYAQLREQGISTLEARRRMLEDHREAVRAQIAQLEACRDLLDYKVDYYEMAEQQVEAGLPVPTYRAPERK